MVALVIDGRQPRNYCLMRPRRTRALCGIDGFDIFSFRQGTFVTAQATFGKFVHALIDRSTTGLDHVENATLVRGQSHHFAGNFATQFRAGTEFLCVNVCVCNNNNNNGVSASLNGSSESEREPILEGLQSSRAGT